MTNILTVMPWRRLIKVGAPFWVSDKRDTGVLYLVIILLFMSVKAYLAVFVVETAGHFMTAIEQKSMPDVYWYLFLSLVAIAAIVPIEVFFNFTKTKLSLVWRQWLTESLIARYFNERNGLAIESSPEIDNPEQRMTQDVDSFCNSSVRLSMSILDAAVNVCTFIVVLWKISPTLSFTVLAYSTAGLLIVSHIGKYLITLCDQQIALEADLRSTLKEARQQLISTAGNGNQAELSKAMPAVPEAGFRLREVVSTLLNMMIVHKNIQLFTGAYNHIMPLIPAMIIAPSYMAGEIPFGTITQAVLAFTAVFHGATVLIGSFGDLSHFAAIVNRVGSLFEGTDDQERAQQRMPAAQITP